MQNKKTAFIAKKANDIEAIKSQLKEIHKSGMVYTENGLCGINDILVSNSDDGISKDEWDIYYDITPDKEYSLIFDFAQNYLNYGPYELIENLFPVLDDGTKKKKELTPGERKERVVQECSKCGMVMKGVHCDICGHVLKKPTQWIEAGDLKFVAGKMIDIKKTDHVVKKKKAETRDDKLLFSAMLKSKLNMLRREKPTLNVSGMFAHKYRAKFGVWPVGDFSFKAAIPTDPSTGFESWYRSQNIRYAKRKEK